MIISLNNEKYNLIIDKKITTKNTYIRVKENLDIYVTCNTFTTDREVIKLINSNEKSILKMIEKRRKKIEKEESFYYLGKKYDLVYLNKSGITFGEEKVFVSNDFDLNKWYLKMANEIFKSELDKMYNSFIYDIPYPSLTIRKMKTRWGVCNTKNHNITLNRELYRYDIKCLDYVIVHELSHFIEPNHSSDFWIQVSKYCPNYKDIRKILND